MAAFSLRSLTINRRGAGDLPVSESAARTVDECLRAGDRQAELARALRRGSAADAQRLIAPLCALMRGKWLTTPWDELADADFAALANLSTSALGAACLRLASIGRLAGPRPRSFFA